MEHPRWKIKCPVHGQFMNQEQLSYMDLWYCAQCGVYYTSTDVKSTAVKVRNRSVISLPKATLAAMEKKLTQKPVVTKVFEIKPKEKKPSKYANRIFSDSDWRRAASKSEVPAPSAKSKQKRNSNLPLKLPDHITEKPKSALVKVTVFHQTIRIGECVIVTDSKYQDTQNGVYWVDRYLSREILSSLLLKNYNFRFHDIKFRIDQLSIQKFKPYTSYEKMALKFCQPGSPQFVFVYKHKSHSWFDSDNYETVTALVPCADSKIPIPMTVIHEKAHDLYYINQESYDMYCRKHGLPYIKLMSADSGEYDSDNDWCNGELNEESPLRLYGYVVNRQDGLNRDERRSLLSRLIDSGLLYKTDIIRHLEWLIHTREGIAHMSDSCHAWREDLNYVLNYRRDKDKIIWASGFAPAP